MAGREQKCGLVDSLFTTLATFSQNYRIPNRVMRSSQRTTEASREIVSKPRSFPYLMDLQ